MKMSKGIGAATGALILSLGAFGGTIGVHAQSPSPASPQPLTPQDVGSLSTGGVSDPTIQTPTQAQLAAHVQRLEVGNTLATSNSADSITPDNVPGNYNGLSRNVGTGLYSEPNTYAYRNYCGPGASQVLISNWTTNVPSIDTLASQEQTDPNWGTYLSNMVGPINSDANTGGFYVNNAASSQAYFNNWIAGDIYNSGRAAITSLMTSGTYSGTIWLKGWDSSGIDAAHIITIHGFNFSNPPSAGDNFYYTETSGTVAGTDATGRNTYGANKMWALVSENDGQIW